MQCHVGQKLLLTHGPVAQERAMADILPIETSDSTDGNPPDVHCWSSQLISAFIRCYNLQAKEKARGTYLL
jgi:hypothetical protein